MHGTTFVGMYKPAESKPGRTEAHGAIEVRRSSRPPPSLRPKFDTALRTSDPRQFPTRLVVRLRQHQRGLKLRDAALKLGDHDRFWHLDTSYATYSKPAWFPEGYLNVGGASTSNG